ncbi:hypothetical protein Tco_0140644 [Tanacetum coccineum]
MVDPNITMEQYIRLKEEKARKHEKVFNRETAKYGKIWYDEDIYDLRSVEDEFLAIAFNDEVSSKTLSYEPTVSSLNDEIDIRISFDDSDDEDYTVIFNKNSFSYKVISSNDLKMNSVNDNEKVNLPSLPSPEPAIKDQNVVYFNDLFPFNIIHPDDLKSEKDNDDNEIDIIQSSGGMIAEAKGLEYTDADIADFESRLARIYRRESTGMFKGRACLLAELRGGFLILETHYYTSSFSSSSARMSWREFILALGLYIVDEMQTVGFGAYWADNARQIPDKGDLRDYWIGILSAGDFLGTAPFYTAIQDPILRVCHRLIACSIAGRSQAPEKVTVTDLFHLRGIDIGLVNVPYLLGRYLKLFVAGRKSGAHISGGQFVARLAEHFGLLSAEILRGLTVIAPKLPIIDMAELDAPGVDEGVQADPAPVQAPPPPPPPPAAARTMPQRMDILEEDVHKIRRALVEQCGVIGALARDFSRLTVWAASGIAQLLDSARVTYTPYPETRILYQRRVIRRTGPRERNINEYWWRIYKSGDLEVLES